MTERVNKGVDDLSRTLGDLLRWHPLGEYVITIESVAEWTKRQKRTNSQNALLWAWLGDVAKLMNRTLGDWYWTAQMLHDYLCVLFASDEVTQEGEHWRRPVETSKLSKGAMSEFIDKIQGWLATELGVSVPLPGDRDYERFQRYINS